MAALLRGHNSVRSTPEPRVSDLSGRHGSRPPGRPFAPARPCGHGTEEAAEGRFSVRCASRPSTGPAPSRRSPTSSEGVRPSVVTSAKRHKPDRRTYVLDTSVLLADPHAPSRFDEHEVVLPVVVVTELEAKRNHPELGYFARQALRLLDDYRVRYGRLDAPIPTGDLGGTLRVELNHSDPSVLPSGYRLGDNDSASSRSPAICRRRDSTSPSSRRTSRSGSRRPPSASSPRSTARSSPSRTPPAGPGCPS